MLALILLASIAIPRPGNAAAAGTCSSASGGAEVVSSMQGLELLQGAKTRVLGQMVSDDEGEEESAGGADEYGLTEADRLEAVHAAQREHEERARRARRRGVHDVASSLARLLVERLFERSQGEIPLATNAASNTSLEWSIWGKPSPKQNGTSATPSGANVSTTTAANTSNATPKAMPNATSNATSDETSNATSDAASNATAAPPNATALSERVQNLERGGELTKKGESERIDKSRRTKKAKKARTLKKDSESNGQNRRGRKTKK